MSEKLIITGGQPLYGSVRVCGAKNASYKIMIASLLANSPSRLLNLPGIHDVMMTADIIRDLGGEVSDRGERMLHIDPRDIKNHVLPHKYGEASRSSTMFLPILLSKFGKATVPAPGGDKIGKRPLERHFEGLIALGAKVEAEGDNIKVKLPGGRFKGAHYRFAKNSHTGTETLLMAAVLADGLTVLENAAEEPEVDDLINYLNRMGARIRRRSFRTIEIHGVENLEGTTYKIMPDRNETISYACAAIATKGDVVIENARHEDLTAFLNKLTEINAGYEIGDYGVRFFYKGKLRPTDVTTQIHPGFMTDWQPLWATLISQADGESIIHETVMQNRFQYVDVLREMGAHIEVIKEPQVQNPEDVYNFNLGDRSKDDIRAIKIFGPTKFHGGEFTIHDLRAGATTILAALSGKGKTILHNLEQLDRGYEKFDEKLISLGAKIERVVE
ncbi:MAG: UDP-N-acetylglucosamine 1-carboxyvinyltransferase [Pseudomonadales bacterium]|jgi:UDP-N-acetylglucosamine 1-carboxyvinyltransferase|nr:UDP-N-acetylglucosamine 1-carboxyvinyltransferase [Pseudomonadales bacterium]